jgi:TPR repeat protein
MYVFGEGVPNNEAEAARWYRLAAEHGYATAQLHLAVAYENGHGVPQDEVEAVRWYRKAAEQGYASAQHKLGYAYAYGLGVAINEAEAKRWLRMDAEQENAEAQNILSTSYSNGAVATPDVLTPQRVAHRAFSSVVLVTVNDSHGQPFALGSGFFVRPGVVATNLHVIKGASGGFVKIVDEKTRYAINGTVAMPSTTSPC